jgi:hypothetical protein
VIRPLIGGVGIAGAAYGGWRLLDLGWENLGQALVWLAGGVVLHDALVAPFVIGLWLLARRAIPGGWRAPFAVLLIVVGTVTVGALPVLLRLGARADNPTLLDRDYVIGWLMLVASVTVVVGLTYAVSGRALGRRGAFATRRSE